MKEPVYIYEFPTSQTKADGRDRVVLEVDANHAADFAGEVCDRLFGYGVRVSRAVKWNGARNYNLVREPVEREQAGLVVVWQPRSSSS